MIASMTGFGRGEAEAGPYRFRVELRSLNHRFFEFSARLPRELWAWEDALRRQVAARIHRGRVDAVVHWQAASGTRALRVDMPLVVAYHNALDAVRRQLGLSGEISLALLAQRPELFVFEDASPDEAAVAAGLAAATERALAELTAAREAEGRRLVEAMGASLDRVRSALDALAGLTAKAPEQHLERLRRRLAELLGGTPVDPQRLAMEAAVLAERLDVGEELVRLRSHLAALAEALAGPGPVGRRCEFLLQEAQREVHTLAAKVQDAAAAGLAVDVRVELERLREQAQNLE